MNTKNKKTLKWIAIAILTIAAIIFAYEKSNAQGGFPKVNPSTLTGGFVTVQHDSGTNGVLLDSLIGGSADGNGIYSGSGTVASNISATLVSDLADIFKWSDGNAALSFGMNSEYNATLFARKVGANPQSYVEVDPDGIFMFQNTSNELSVSSNTFNIKTPNGARYFADYSGTYTDRSLPDWGSVKGLISDSLATLPPSTDDQTAAEVTIADAGGLYVGGSVEDALQEVGALGPVVFALGDSITAHRAELDAITSGAYTPTITSVNSADTVLSVTPAYWTKVGGIVSVTARFKVAVFASPGETTQNQFRFNLPVPTGHSADKILGTWTARQYDTTTPNSNFDEGVVRSAVAAGGFSQCEFEYKRNTGALTFPDNHFEISIEFKYQE